MARAVIFDFDGVIVHSEPTHLLAVREVVGPLGITLTDQAYYDQYVHLPDRELLRRVTHASGREATGESLQRLLAAKHDAFERLLAKSHGVQVCPGVLDLIRACAARVPVALCTAAERRTVHAVLGGIGIIESFRVITTADDVVRSKPDPLPYARTCESLGIPAAECVAVEDTVGGLTSAKGAGCRAVAVGHTQARARLVAADLFIERIADLTPETLLAL